MDNQLMLTYRTVSQVQQAISNARTLDEALREGLRTITKSLGAENSVIWYAEGDDPVLSPYFWLADTDLTTKRHAPGEGSVGRAFESQRAERMLTYRPGMDPSAESDFEGTTIRSMIVVPFSTMSDTLGAIQFVNKANGEQFTNEDADVCEMLAMLAAISITENEALDLVGLGARKENYPSQMSGGQQQRVSIARALIKRPKLIFADEPTAALDYSTSIEVLQVMERVVATGTTMVMVTHNEEICRMADRVVRMRDGRTHEVTVNRIRAAATDLVW